MKSATLVLSFFVSMLAHGQNHNMPRKLEPVDGNFWYKIDDDLEFRGTRLLCTLQFNTIFTKVVYNDSARTLYVHGYFLLGSKLSDTTHSGFAGASIYLLNFDENGRINKLFDLGSTDDKYDSPKVRLAAGRFSRTFSVTRGDILVIGLSGIHGATAFDVGKVLEKY